MRHCFQRSSVRPIPLLLMMIVLLGIVTVPTSATPATRTLWLDRDNSAGDTNGLRGLHEWGSENLVPQDDPATDSYNRFHWDELEKRDKQGHWYYDFSAIESRAVRARSRGQKFSFRIQAMLPGEKNVPSYITNGSWCSDGTFVPNWNSRDFLGPARRLMTALGKRFNGDPRIGWVDIGLYGTWGEWHTFNKCGVDATDATARAIIDMHIDAFPDTQLVMMVAHEYGLSYAMQQSTNIPIGWRSDSWGNDHFHNHTSRRASTWGLIKDRWKIAPVIVETMGTRTEIKLGPQQVTDYHISAIGNGNLGRKWSALDGAERWAFAESGRRAGFRFQFRSLTLPDTLAPGQRFDATSAWSNLGNAPAYESWRVRIQLRQNNQVRWYGTSSLNLRTFLPDDELTVSDTWTLPSNLPTGTYEITVQVVDAAGYRAPLTLANGWRRSDGSYRLGEIRVQREADPTPHPIGLLVDQDTFVQDGKPNDSFGGWSILYVKANHNGWNRQAYLRFDLRGLEATSVEQALVKLPVTELPDGPTTVAIRSVYTDSWSESTSWRSQPGQDRWGSVLDTVTITSVGSTATFDVAPFINAELRDGHSFASFVLTVEGPDRKLVTFSSREATTLNQTLVEASTAPSLDVVTSTYGHRLDDEWLLEDRPLYLPLIHR